MKTNNCSFILIVILTISVILSGCSPTQEISEALSPTSTESSLQSIQETPSQEAASTKAPTNTPQPAAQELVLTGEQGFIQEGTIGVFLFAVENPNKGYALESSEYQIEIYDATGSVLDTSSGYISLVLPEEKLFVAADFYLEEGQTADRIEVQIDSGSPEELELTEAPFTVDQVEFLPDDWFPQISGVVNNKLNRDVSDMRITAVAFDSDGKIIGGGATYLNFLPPNGKSAVDVNITVNQTPAKVEIYPTISGLSVFTEAASTEGGLVLLDYNFTQSKYGGGVAFLIQNTNTTSAIASAQFRVEAYDDADVVLDTSEGYINILFPGEKQAVFTDLSIPDGKTITKVTVQIKQGDTTASEFSQNPFAAEKIIYQPGDYSEYVTAVISNSSEQTMEDLEVVAVGYDDDGKIVGGGYTYLDFVHGKDTAGVQISYRGDQAPSTVEVYTSMSSLTSLKSTNQKETVKLVDFGYGIQRQTVSVGFLVQNTESNSAIESTRYIATAYDVDGYVLASSSGYIDVIFPDQTIAGATDILLPSGKIAEKIEVLILPGSSEPVPSSGYPFSVENVSYIAGGYTSKATGLVKSTLSNDVDYVKVIAIAYDENGKIIGGGFTYLDFIPANGESAVDVPITIGATPARIELYPTFSSLSNLTD